MNVPNAHLKENRKRKEKGMRKKSLRKKVKYLEDRQRRSNICT